MPRPIEFRLVPTPGAKSEFLAILESKSAASGNGADLLSQLPSKITLEAYTRDAWAADSTTKWQSISFHLASNTNGVNNNKLPGFINYLRQRGKAAFGRFPSKADGSTIVIIVPSKQASSQMANCRFAKLSSIPNCPLRPIKLMAPPSSQQQQQAKPVTKAPPKTIRKKGAGLLGNLVGAQKRTNQHLNISRQATAARSVPSASGNAKGPAGDGVAASATQEQGASLKTAGQVLAEFRQELEQKMLDFDIAPDPVIKISLDLTQKLKKVVPHERENGRITIEILKYLVYEAAEDVNEEWIAHREPSEFLDDVVIAVYKEGEAPPEVLEDINKGELPDEVRGQQQALQQQQQRQEQQRAMKNMAEQQRHALKKAEADDESFAALNQNKRDRRTIEEIQRSTNDGDDDENTAKRMRT